MTSGQNDLVKITRSFFDSIQRRDWESATELIHPEARALQNVSGQETNARELLQSMQGLVSSLKDFSYENIRSIACPHAVVEQHDVHMLKANGGKIVLDVCIILRFDDAGLIVRIDEYFDSAPLSGLLN